MTDNLYQAPGSELRVDDETPPLYGGFWIRVGAALVDTVLLMVVSLPLLAMIYGSSYWTGEALVVGIWDVLINYVFPALAVILFWVYKSATPGKMLCKLRIVDARTGGKPRTAQLVGRYLAYYISAVPLLLGIIWIAFDKRKQGWHDKLAGTVVLRDTGGIER